VGTRTISDTPAAGVAWVYDMNRGVIQATEDTAGTLFDESIPD
jgi:hypothetical protein